MMKRLLPGLLSLRTTLILVAIIAGIYLFLTFGNENAWNAMVDLIKESVPVRILFALLVSQIFLCGVVRLVRRKDRSFLSGFIMFSLSLITAAMLFSLYERETVRKTVSIHEEINDGLGVFQIDLKIPGEFLAIGEKGDFKIERAGAVLDDHGKKIPLRMFPPTRTSAGLAIVNDGGIAPPLELRLGNEKFMVTKLNLFPPGRHSIVPLGEDYKMEISFMPGREFRKGRLTAREYDLMKPRYRVVVKKGNDVILEHVLAENQKVEKNGIRIICGTTEKWIEILLARDISVYMLYTGITGLLAGMVLLPFWAYRIIRGKRFSEK